MFRFLAVAQCHEMTPAEFKTKWAKFSGKESAAYQEHFGDLCRMLGVTPLVLSLQPVNPRRKRAS